MPKAKSLVKYKLGYDPDSKKKTIDIEYADNGATRTFSIPVVSGNKEVEYQINEQLPLFHELSTALGYTGPNKFTNFGKYLSGAFKSSWENELRDNFNGNNQRTNPGFRRALLGTMRRFYGHQDLRKAGLKYVEHLKWQHINNKYDHTPATFTQRIETLYDVLKQLDIDPGTTPMPTDRQMKEHLVESFPKEYQVYYDFKGGDYTESMVQIGQIMEDHFDRENESDSEDSNSKSSGDDNSDSESSSDSDSCSDDEHKKKRKKSTRKKSTKKKNKSKKSKKSKKKSKQSRKSTTSPRNTTASHHPNSSDICPIHGGHIWANCRLNPRSENYDPPKPYQRQQFDSRGRGYQGRGQGGYQGRGQGGRGGQAYQQQQQQQQQQYYNEDNLNQDSSGVPPAPQVRPSVTWSQTPRQSSYATTWRRF